jgi:sugar-specific transcriptional regulator TrmB
MQEYEEKAIEILSSMGLNKNEIIIYLDLMKNYSSPALEVSRRTNIHRSNTYDSLRKLVEKGFVKENIEENKRVFQAIDPEKIKDYIMQKHQEFDLILPQLKNLSSTENYQSTVSISQGIFATREALIDLLALGEPIYVYGASKEAVESFGLGFLKEFHKARINKKIFMGHVYNKNALERINSLNKMKYTEARYLPEKYDTVVATVICGKRVLFLIFSKPVIVITMNNPEIADAYRKYYDILWKKAKS